MRIIARRTLREFIGRRAGHKDQPALKAALDAWFDEARRGRWTSVADIKALYRTASVVTAERVVFNIKGNDYRLVTSVDFEKGHYLDQVARVPQGLRPDRREKDRAWRLR